MRYSHYKPTGIAWLPEVPEGWECVRLGVLGSFSNGLSKEAEAFGSGQPFVSYGDVYRNYALPKEIKGLVQSTSAEQEACSLRRGDVLFTRTSESIDEIGFSSACLVDLEKATFAGFLIRYRPRTETTVPEFSKYYFRNCRLRTYFRLRISGIITRASLSQSVLRGLPVMLPPLPTQRAIVAFLDEKCGKVDRLVAAKEKEVALLKELKQSMIAEAVCGKVKVKGEGEQRKFKPSGIPWLPEVPEGWEVKRLKSLFNLRHESYSPEEQLMVLSLIKDVGVIPYDEKGSVGNKSKEDITGYNVARKGDVVMNSMNVIIGSVDITPYDGYISPAYYALTAREGVEVKYFNYLFHLKAVQKTMRSLAKGILEIRLRISITSLFGMTYPVPPLAEQREIVAHIEAKAAKIDAAVAGLEREIAALKEYKQRLIADVVTGQRKVA